MKWHWRHTFLGIAIGVPIAATLFAWSLAPPLLNSDSATGFSVWENMTHGGAWNCLNYPDPADIAHNTDQFVSWWSPGQYIFPGLIHALGFTWCHAALLTTLAASLHVCLGVWCLSLYLGLSRDQSALAVLLVSVGCGALHDFGMYEGGDILLAAAAPFIYLTALRTCDWPPLRGFLAFFAICLAGLFLKHSAILVIAAALLFLALESARGRQFPPTRFWLAVTAAILALICAHLLWIRGGPTPGDSSEARSPVLTTLGFVLNGPWFALTGAGSLISWFLQRAGFDGMGTSGWTRIDAGLLVIGIPCTALIVWLGLRAKASIVWRLASCAWLAVSGLLALLYLRGASVSFDERHFIAATAPLAAALACAALPSDGRRFTAHLATVFIVFTLLFSLAIHVRRVRLLASLPHDAPSGFSQPDMSSAVRRSLIDATAADSLIVLLCPSQAFDFPDRRLLPTDALFRTGPEISRWHYAGQVPAIVVSMPIAYESDGRGALLRAAFTSIPAKAWHSFPIDNQLVWSWSAPVPTPAP